MNEEPVELDLIVELWTDYAVILRVKPNSYNVLTQCSLCGQIFANNE